LEDDDGPMLDVLNRSEGVEIQLPARRAHLPDRERLAIRFERFRSAV
jgi:putative restriction endonuclease